MKRKLLKRGMVLILLFLFYNSHYISSHADSKPDTPTGIRVWRHSNTKLRLKWNRVKKADGYLIYKYDKVKKKYKKYKTITNNKTIVFIDQVGSRTSAKYRVSAFKSEGNKKLTSTKSYAVRARTYKQGDKKVNAGKVKS